MSFESELAAGRFKVPECPRCGDIVWPPAPRCGRCLGGTELRGSGTGTVIEFSKKDGKFFGVVDFEGIRLMAGIVGVPREGQEIRMSRCGVTDSGYFFEVESCSGT